MESNVVLNEIGPGEIPANFTGIVRCKDGTRIYQKNGERHREDGPAWDGTNGDGSKAWWLHGRLHRVDGPAVEWADGRKEWHFDGKLVLLNTKFIALNNSYIVLERGIPTNKMFGKLKLTNAKLLTAKGTLLVYDNLPGLEIGEGNDL